MLLKIKPLNSYELAYDHAIILILKISIILIIKY